MAAKNIPKHEPRTRVVFNLPVNHWGEEKAFYEVIGHLRGLKDRRSGVTGFTYSDPMPAVFTGYWWSDDQHIWMEDAIVIVMAVRNGHHVGLRSLDLDGAAAGELTGLRLPGRCLGGTRSQSDRQSPTGWN